MIEIKRYTPAQAQEWNEFVALCCNATFLHQRGYMDYHSDRFTDHSLMAYSDGRLVAVLPANAAGTVIYSHQGLTYGGWLHPARHFDATVMMEVMQSAMAWLSGEGFTQWVYKPVPHIYHRYPAEEDLYALFRAGAELTEVNISTSVRLAEPLAFDRGNKRGVNAAMRAGVQVAESDDWEGYWRVLEQVLAERHATRPVHTVEEIKLLHSRFPESIKLYTAVHDGHAADNGADVFSQAQCAYAGRRHRRRKPHSVRQRRLDRRHMGDRAAARRGG